MPRIKILNNPIIFQQQGFSVLGLFLLGLLMLAIMSYAGLFRIPKSEVLDTEGRSATGAKNVDGKSLLITELDFSEPTPTTPPPTTPQPTVPIPTPTVRPADACDGYAPVSGCTCYDPFHINVWCDGRLPPTTPDCEGTLAQCQDQITGKSNCREYCAAKPVIYLYPPIPTFVDVKITTPGQFVEHIPPLEFYSTGENETIAGWTKVLAQPSGVLFYNNYYYRELFYDTSLSYVRAPDHGKFIKTKNLKKELYEFVTELGLITDEANEFVDYWVPKLTSLNKKYIFTSIVDNDEKQRVDKVEITPKPDVFIEFMAYFNGVNEKFESKPLLLPKVPERKGFTAVEWGGVIEPSSYE